MKISDCLAVILIVGFIIFVMVTGGCNRFKKEQNIDSGCKATCVICVELEMECEHGLRKDHELTINQQ